MKDPGDMTREECEAAFNNAADRMAAKGSARHAEPVKVKRHKFLETLNQPPLKWLIESVIPEKGIVLLFGQSSAFKTFFALDIGLSIGSGRDFMELKTLPGRVLYIAGEGFYGMEHRLKAWCIAHDVKPEELEGRVDFISQSCPLDDPAFEAGLRAAIVEFVAEYGEAPRLLFVDTLNRNMVGDENSARDFAAVTRACERLRDEFGTAVCLIHHTGHEGGRERGSSAINGALDANIQVKRDGGGKDKRPTGMGVTLTVVKLRNAAEGLKRRCTAVVTVTGQDENGIYESARLAIRAGIDRSRGRGRDD